MNDVLWQFVYDNEKEDVTKLLLKQHAHSPKDVKWAVKQIEARQKARTKLPSWYNKKHVEFPSRVSVEQSSSEVTATFKASKFQGKKLIDLTGGFGVDAFHFAQSFENVTYCERNDDLVEVVTRNQKIFGIENLEILKGDGLEILHSKNKRYDLIYLDPARRDANNRKVVLLNQYQPDILKHLDLFFEKSDEVLVKTSPMLDITQAIQQIGRVKQVWVLGVGNEVKELLFLLNKKETEYVKITGVVLQDKGSLELTYPQNDLQTKLTLSTPLKYLYEPHPVLLKGALHDAYASQCQLSKLHPHSHLYTSTELNQGFCGRTFMVESLFSLNKKEIKKNLISNKANITVRNFPLNVATIRKRTGLKEGGDVYLFATTLRDNQKVLVKCRKIA